MDSPNQHVSTPTSTSTRQDSSNGYIRLQAALDVTLVSLLFVALRGLHELVKFVLSVGLSPVGVVRVVQGAIGNLSQYF